MKHRKYKPDLSGWTLDAFDKASATMETCFRDAVSEALHLALEDGSTYIYFPVEWDDQDGLSGPAVEDPLTCYLRFGLESDGESPTYEFNLRDALDDSIESCAHDGSFSEGLGRLSLALRQLADEIEAARLVHSK